MWKALLWKELRETWWIAAAGLLAYLALVSSFTGYDYFDLVYGNPSVSRKIPFLAHGGDFTHAFAWISGGFVVVLGFVQTVGESLFGTWPFFLHHPAGLRKLLGAKFLVGLGLYFVIAALPILAYAAWAATPGTHATPFCWWMTGPTWKAYFVLSLAYLGAFLSGIRPGHWLGTRLLPALAVCTMVAFAVDNTRWSWIEAVLLFILAAVLVCLIFFTARNRDY